MVGLCGEGDKSSRRESQITRMITSADTVSGTREVDVMQDRAFSSHNQEMRRMAESSRSFSQEQPMGSDGDLGTLFQGCVRLLWGSDKCGGSEGPPVKSVKTWS